MITEGVNSNAPHFRIFTTQIVLRDKGLHLVAHRFVDCHLSRDCSAACSFGTSTSFKQGTPTSTGSATHFSSTFSFSQRPVQPSLEGFYC
jgi:hypothetical protein